MLVKSPATCSTFPTSLALMGFVHDLIEQQGKEAALLAEVDRCAVEAAAAYMADEDFGSGFSTQAGVRPLYPIDAFRMERRGRSHLTK